MNNQQRYEHKKLQQASHIAGQEMIELVDLIEGMFGTNRIRATLAAGVLICSVTYQVANHEETQKQVMEIINDADIDVQNKKN